MQWNVIFLLDQTPPTKIVLLHRSSTKAFAPNMFTGIGGKKEEGETIEESAYRELEEETGIADTPLHHFADFVISNGNIISYFYGVYPYVILPSCTEGDLSWVKVEELFKKPIIPTTQLMIGEWKQRYFSVHKQWTILGKEIGKKDGMAIEEVVEIKEGLYT